MAISEYSVYSSLRADS